MLPIWSHATPHPGTSFDRPQTRPATHMPADTAQDSADRNRPDATIPANIAAVVMATPISEPTIKAATASTSHPPLHKGGLCPGHVIPQALHGRARQPRGLGDGRCPGPLGYHVADADTRLIRNASQNGDPRLTGRSRSTLRGMFG